MRTGLVGVAGAGGVAGVEPVSEFMVKVCHYFLPVTNRVSTASRVRAVDL